MESKFDYITLTLKSKVHTYEEALNTFSDTLLLGDLIGKMVVKGGVGFYDYHLSYENIEFYFTDPDRFEEQGMCFKFSGQGLDYFNKYLASYGLNLKDWLGRFRSLAFEDYMPKFTRVDYAMDDICLSGEKPCITLKKIIKCVDRGEVCKKARTIDILNGSDISERMRIKKIHGKVIKARTLYIGVRQSGMLVRFYDKLAEQIQRKLSVSNNVTDWTRCEVEFHDDSAMGVINAYLDYSADGFSDYICGVVNNQCRFITLNNDNISRCSTKRWWSEFLNGCTHKFKLPHKAPARSALARAERGLRQYVRTIYTLFQELGLEGVYSFFENEVNILKANNKEVFKHEIAENLREDMRDYEEMNPFSNYLYNSDFPADRFSDRIRSQRGYYNYRYRQATTDNRILTLHDIFMSGQEVLFDGL